jgi:hypothetical protein
MVRFALLRSKVSISPYGRTKSTTSRKRQINQR